MHVPLCRSFTAALASVSKIEPAALRRWPAATHLHAVLLHRAGRPAAAAAAFADAIALAPANIGIVT